MAGGKGTRIASIANDIPKPMITLNNKPILEYQINCLKKNGLTDITLVIGHLGYAIKNYFGNGNAFGVKIDYFEESFPLGTAGALYKIGGITEDFLLLCGDTIFDINFNYLINFHNEKKAWATLVSHPNGHPYDSSLIVTELIPSVKSDGIPIDSHKVIQWINKEDNRFDHFYKNRVNAGIEIISPILLATAAKTQIAEKVDLDRNILKPLVDSGRIYAYDTPEYIKDMGTPDRYYQTETDIKKGRVQQRNLSCKQKAIFIDRDGTLNKDVGFLIDINDMQLIPGIPDAIKKINELGYLVIVITNQPVIARGEISFEQLQQIHNKLETLLGTENAYIDALYYCPHHPDKGFYGERIEYKCNCFCRKPNPGMILQAAKDFNIDLLQSYMIGDSDTDILAGKAAGCLTIKVSTSYTLRNFVSDYLK